MRKSSPQNQGSKVYNLYDNPEIYDIVYPGNKGDLSFYAKIIHGKKSCYLGAGTGRLFGPLSKKNENLLGIDNSKKMISKMRTRFSFIKEDKIALVDAKKMKFNKKFEVIIAPHSFLTQFAEEDVIKILKLVKKSLVKNGLFITDFFSPFKNPHFSQASENYKNIKRKGLIINQTIFYDYVKQELEELTQVKKGDDRFGLKVKLHYYFPNEIKRFFEKAGLHVISAKGSFSGTLLTCESPLLVFKTKN